MIERTLRAALALALAVAVLAGCRTSPDVAAYVGEDRVTVAELTAAVEERLADPDVAAYAQTLPAGGFARQVLNLAIGERVYAQVAEAYDVEVTPGEVSDRLAELLGGEDEDTLFAQLAEQRGLVPDDAREIIRQLLLREEVAQAEGLVDLSDAGLDAAYDEYAAAPTEVRIGYFVVPDQATADAVVAQLTADPTTYPALAALYPSSVAIPEPELRTVADLPPELADLVPGALPAGALSLPVAELGGVLVAQVALPSREDVTAELAGQLQQQASDAAQPLVDDLEAGLEVTVNPRYGSLEDGSVVPADGGVVEILEDAAASTPGAPAGD